MENNKEKILHDLEYYQAGIKQLYMKTYQRYLFLMIAAMLVTLSGIGYLPLVLKMLFILLFLAEIGGVVYLVRFLQEATFESYFNQIKEQLPEEFSKMAIVDIQEDVQSYYFTEKQDMLVKINKKNARNFPSTMRKYTLLVGFTNDLEKSKLAQPLHFFYYDITRMKHSDKYKQDMLKNSNFIEKRKKKRIRSGILMLILFMMIGYLIYFF